MVDTVSWIPDNDSVSHKLADLTPRGGLVAGALVCTALLGSACALLVGNVDGHLFVADGGVTQGDDARPVSRDAGIRDATSTFDRQTSTDAGHPQRDALVEALPYCASIDASFCADFDESTLTAAWPMPLTWSTALKTQGEGTLALDPSMSVSAPSSLRSSVTTVTGMNTSGGALLVRYFQVSSSLHVEFDVYASPPSDSTDYVFSLGRGTTPCAYNVAIEGKNDGLGNVALQLNQYNCTTGFSSIQAITTVALGGAWQHFIVDTATPDVDAATLDANAPVGQITVRLGTAGSAPILRGSIEPLVGTISVAVGPYGLGTWTLNYDNVVVDVR